MEEKGAKSLKRSREDTTMEVDTETLSKTAQKKLNKKLKAESGKAVASGADVENKDGEEKKSEKKSKKDKKDKTAEKAEAPTPEKSKPTTKTLEGGLKYTETAVGTGPTAKKGNTVGMRYIGKLADKSIFDKNVSGKAVCLLRPPHCPSSKQLTFSTVRLHIRKRRGHQGLGHRHCRHASRRRARSYDTSCDGIREIQEWKNPCELHSYLRSVCLRCSNAIPTNFVLMQRSSCCPSGSGDSQLRLLDLLKLKSIN